MKDLQLCVHVVAWRLRQRMLPKCVPHVQHDYFSSFNQSDHCFLAPSLPLPLSLLSSLLTKCGRNSYRTREIFLNFPIRPRLGILAVEPTGNPSIPGTPGSPSRPRGPWKQELTNSSLGTSPTQISTVIGNSLAVHAVRMINQEKYSVNRNSSLSHRSQNWPSYECRLAWDETQNLEHDFWKEIL